MRTIFSFQRYGDYGDREQPASDKSGPAGKEAESQKPQDVAAEWPLWEVFIRSKSGLDHKHAGSLHAADAKMAIENARDVYTRRMEGISIWVVESNNIHASDPYDGDGLYEPATDKVYRHPTFYDIPEEIGHM